MRTFIVNIDDSLQGAEDDIDELERKWGAEEIEHKCHNCAHYLKGEYDGSCGSYICKDYSDWGGVEMKIIMIDCDAEEIRANRTLFDSITDAVSGFVSNMNNVGITPEMLAALHEDEEETEDGE